MRTLETGRQRARAGDGGSLLPLLPPGCRMKSRLAPPALLLLVALGALAIRLPRLDDRPMHADEAVQAAIFLKLWLDGQYAYIPH